MREPRRRRNRPPSKTIAALMCEPGERLVRFTLARIEGRRPDEMRMILIDIHEFKLKKRWE